MRIRLPSSRGSLRIRLSIFDAAWAFVAPLLALYVRGAQILTHDDAHGVAVYCALSGGISLFSFWAFRLRDGMTGHFSVPDAIDVAKAVACAGLLTYAVMFTFTRLDGIPRSTPIIHVLVLGAGLVAARTFARIFETVRIEVNRRRDATEQIVMIGSNALSSLYIRFLEAYFPGEQRVAAVLDDRSHLIGTTVAGIRVAGPPHHLQPLIDEFAEHGIRINRVIVGGEAESLSPEVIGDIERICNQRDIKLDFVPRLVGLCEARELQVETLDAGKASPPVKLALPSYFHIKRIVDLVAALVIVVLLLPVLVLIAGLVLLDVGSPVLFWQQRIGAGGSTFLLQKFRTLRPPFDWNAQPVPDEQRLSWIGRILRTIRLDELPQLLNVLVGDMSIVGPRPLLPRDQPPNPGVRLMVRPGITGWAQVNGGNLLTPAEKDELDEWYIRNASLRLDLRIVGMTILFLFRGERRSEQALEDARCVRNGEDADWSDWPTAKHSP